MSRNAILENRTGLLKIMVAASLFGTIMLGTGCETTSWAIGKDLEAKTERFGWATPECVEQEVGNPDYRNNSENLRLCQLEHRVEELERRLKEALGVPK